jgi:hypothetical protein
MKAVIDRVEGELAVLLMGENRLNFPLAMLPEGCKEGDILEISIERAPLATQQAKEKATGLIDRLKKKSQGKTGIIRDPETGQQ